MGEAESDSESGQTEGRERKTRPGDMSPKPLGTETQWLSKLPA